MRHVVVRYKVKADRVAEHEALIQGVFAELAERAPAGIEYQVIKLGDGRSFVHVASIDVLAGAENPLTSLPAFKAFSADIAARCEELPVSSDGTRMGFYPPRRDAEAR